MASPDFESIIHSAIDSATNDSDGDGDVDTSDSGAVETSSGGSESEAPNLESVRTTESADSADSADTTEQAPPPEPEDPFAKEHGIQPKRKDGKINYLPYPRVKSIAANAEKKTFEKVTGMPLAEGETIETALPKFQASIQERDQKIAHYEHELGSMKSVEQIMETDATRFLQMASAINPQFAQILDIVNQALSGGAPMGAPGGDNDPEPQPDVDLGNGQVTYSLDGLRALRAWDRRQAQREIEGRLDSTLGPIQREREVLARVEQAKGAIQSYVDDARENWSGFKDWEADILAEIPKTNSRLPAANRLFMAYIRVRDAKHKADVERLSADHNKVRAKVLDELKNRPTSTATTGGAATIREEDDSAEAKADPVSHAIKMSIRKSGLR